MTINLKIKSAIRTTVMGMLVAGCAISAMANDSRNLNKKELKELAASQSPDDQQKLADYYKNQAQQLTVKSQEFAKQADTMAKEPGTIESKQGISCNCTSHYRYFSKLYAQEANEAQSLATQHEALAQKYKVGTSAQK